MRVDTFFITRGAASKHYVEIGLGNLFELLEQRRVFRHCPNPQSIQPYRQTDVQVKFQYRVALCIHNMEE